MAARGQVRVSICLTAPIVGDRWLARRGGRHKARTCLVPGPRTQKTVAWTMERIEFYRAQRDREMGRYS